MKAKFYIDKLVFILTVVQLFCLSCTDEKLVKSPIAGKSAEITFTISMGDTVSETRSGLSGAVDKVIGSFMLGNDSVVLSCEENMLGGTDGKPTRGTPVNTANLESVYGSFSVDGLYVDDNGDLVESIISTDEDGNGKYVVDIDEDGEFDDFAYFWDVPFVKNGSVWTIDTAHFPEFGYFNWPKKDYNAGDNPSNFVSCSFFAYAPSFNILPNTGQPWAGSYSYSGPDGESYPEHYPDGRVEFYHLVDYWNDEDFDEEEWVWVRKDSRVVLEDDAINEPDLLLASTGEINAPLPGQPIELVFYHILSGVRFSVADDFPKGIKLKYVMFDDLWWDGYCTFNPGAPGTNSEDKVSWTFPDGCARASFKQNFDTEVASSRDFENGKVQGGDMLYGDDVAKTFLLIPQSFGASGNSPDAKIIVGVVINGEEKELTLSFPDGSEWLPGKLYTYKLHLNFNDNPDDVNIQIDEDFPSCDGEVDPNPSVEKIYYKENVKFTNTDNIKYYIRAAILAYELDNTDDNIIGGWWKDEEQWLMNTYSDEYDHFDNEGNPPSDLWRTWNFNTEKDWKKFGDYYYYRYPIATGVSTETLFDQLRVPCLHTERSEVDIIGQGIPWDENDDHKGNVRTYWGEDIANWMSNDVKNMD